MFEGFFLDAAALDRLYPCHLVLDAATRVIGAGRVIRRLLPELAATPLLQDAFLLERPQGVTDFASLCRARDLTFVLIARSRGMVRLKGELFPLPDAGGAMLLTVVWFSEGSVLDTLGLTVDDFALSDASADLLFLIETQAALLRDARDEALAASRLKSEFLANMSHELRTPLNAIIGFSEYLLAVSGDTVPPKHREYLDDIRASGVLLLDIINDLLDLARIEQGKLVLEEERIDLGVVVRDAIKFIAETARSRTLRITLRGFDAPITVDADRRSMRQVLLNLLSNAVKFNREGGTVEIAAATLPTGDLSIAIADTGIGVDPAVIPELFEPFRQADSGIARNYGGTGLGLAIVRQLMQLHGGEVTMQSRPGIGTTVSLILPCRRIVTRAGGFRREETADPDRASRTHPAREREALPACR
jgi:signal transduction histidine kinase